MLFKAADGCIWAGTNLGLYRFEGSRFVLKVASIYVSRIAQLHDGRLLLITNGPGEYDGHAGVRNLHVGALLGVADSEVFDVFEDAQGTLWYCTTKGVRTIRRFGKAGGAPPVLLLHHYIGTMDWWDPALTDGLAASREVILFDNRGVGLTSGKTPNRINAMAEDTHAFIHGLGLKQVDLLAFRSAAWSGRNWRCAIQTISAN